MAKKPTKSKRKPKTASRVKLTLKPGETVENSDLYVSETSKKRVMLTKGEAAPVTPLKNERWLQVAELNVGKKAI